VAWLTSTAAVLADALERRSELLEVLRLYVYADMLSPGHACRLTRA
jgi:hypothetical protein